MSKKNSKPQTFFQLNWCPQRSGYEVCANKSKSNFIRVVLPNECFSVFRTDLSMNSFERERKKVENFAHYLKCFDFSSIFFSSKLNTKEHWFRFFFYFHCHLILFRLVNFCCIVICCFCHWFSLYQSKRNELLSLRIESTRKAPTVCSFLHLTDFCTSINKNGWIQSLHQRQNATECIFCANVDDIALNKSKWTDCSIEYQLWRHFEWRWAERSLPLIPSFKSTVKRFENDAFVAKIKVACTRREFFSLAFCIQCRRYHHNRCV